MVHDLRVRGHVGAVSVGMAFVLTVFATLVAAPPVNAADLVQITTCGQSVNTDAVLVKNLICTGDGVIITGEDVTVDLRGHAIRSSTGTGRGVVIKGPHGSTATVRGPGKVQGFSTGIEGRRFAVDEGFQNNRHLIVAGVVFLDNVLGIGVNDGFIDMTATSIRGTNGIFASGTWVNVGSSSLNSTGLALETGRYGFGRFSIGSSRLRGGSVDLGTNSLLVAGGSTFNDVAIEVFDGGIWIEGSRLADSPVSSWCCTGGFFKDNVIRSTKGGTAIDDGANGFGGFRIEGNRFSGWDAAIVVGEYAQVAVTGNRFEGNVTGVLARCQLTSGFGGTGTIRGNTLLHNSGDAISLGCGQWAIGGNLMKDNGGLGINAFGSPPLLQVTDEGDNVARGNAEPQCIGVVCRPR